MPAAAASGTGIGNGTTPHAAIFAVPSFVLLLGNGSFGFLVAPRPEEPKAESKRRCRQDVRARATAETSLAEK